MTTDLMLYDDLAVMAAPTIVAGDEELRKDFARGADDAVEPDADEEQKEDDSDANEGQTVADHVAKIRKVAAEETFAVIKCGYLLINARKELGADGYSIVLEQLGWEPRIAQLRVGAAREFGKLPREVLAQFQPSSMYVLAPRSPISRHRDAAEQASKEALAKAEAGEAVTWVWANGRIKEIKDETAKVEAEAEAKAKAAAAEAAGPQESNEGAEVTKPTEPTGDADEDKDEEEVRILTLFSLLDDATEHFSESEETEKKMLAHRLEALLRKFATTTYADDLRAVLAVGDEDAAAA